MSATARLYRVIGNDRSGNVPAGSVTGVAVVRKVGLFQLQDVLRSRWLTLYGLFFAALAEGLLRFGGGTSQALVGLTQVVVLVVPLVGIVFGTMYLYSAREYIELLLTQPVRRDQLFGGLYLGLIAPLVAAFVVGVSLPFLIRGVPPDAAGSLATMLTAGIFLTLVFAGLAFPIAIRNEERARGLALSLGVWLGLTVVYDAIILLLLEVAIDYPMELPALIAALVNPVDLARILLLLQFDVAALMGYTGAVFERFFGSVLGGLVAFGVLTLWTIAPFALGRCWFRRKDF